MVARDKIKETSNGVLICCGDMPLFLPTTIKRLIQNFISKKPTLAMLTVRFENPSSYGRILRDKQGKISGIREQKDCTPEELNIKECNPGFYIFDSSWLKENIVKLSTNNAQKEYYLTDLVEMAIEQGLQVLTVPVSEESEALGINTPEQLREAEEILKKG
jgi:bifunctional N-acetylglucosamine-1-phosphate-uridyltransferase/glucosamine-1-phosphate-acetyltransferase GlmU-like protein